MESGNTPPLVLNLVLGESGQLHAPAVSLPVKEQHLVISVISNFMEKSFRPLLEVLWANRWAYIAI